MLIVMSMVTFALFFASPIDPARFACGKNCSVELQKQTEKALGYDKPAHEQWTDFATGVFTGRDYPDDPAVRRTAPETIAHCPAPCLGYSQQRAENVTTLIKDAYPISLSLAVAAFIMWMLGGVIFGVI